MKKSTLIWHRGKGRYSIYTGEIDKKVKARHKLSRKKWKSYKQAGDRKGRAYGKYEYKV